MRNSTNWLMGIGVGLVVIMAASLQVMSRNMGLFSSSNALSGWAFIVFVVSGLGLVGVAATGIYEMVTNDSESDE